MLIWKTGEGAFSCSVSDRHGNMGKRKKRQHVRTKKKKKKKNVPDLFWGLGEVAEQPASHRWGRQNRNKV